jgi:Winged helix-turn-helix DNA-binding
MDNILVLTFAEAKQPEYKEKKGVGFIQYGDRNDYPNYLVDLFNKSAKHNAIVKSKVHYITANGWTSSEEARTFVEKVNRTESLEDLTRKVSLDTEIFGGYYLEIIWNDQGQLAEIWHIDYTKIRTNKDNTQFWYKEDWKDNKEEAKVYTAFNPNAESKVKQILYVKEYRPNMGIYSLPAYFGALNYIESDIEISKHVLGNAQTGFSASKLITLPNGEPSDDEKKNIEQRFTKRFSGSDGKKFILSFVTDPQRKPIIDDLGASDITKEDFQKVDELIQTNIFSGHQITTPSIFGIATPGKLGSRSEMRDGYEIFKNTYVNSKQMHLESVFNMLAKLRGIQDPELKIIPTEAIGLELSESILKEIAPKEWLLEKAGIDISKYEPVQEPVQQAQFAEQDFSLFFEFGEAKEGFQVWKQKKKFNDDNEYELFADVSQLQANVLDLITKDKRITPDVIAEVLNSTPETINYVINKLVDSGYLKVEEISVGEGYDENIITERTLTAPISTITGTTTPQTKELLVRYSYEWNTGFDDSDKKTSRPFCKALLDAGKMYSRSEIEQMTMRLGYSVFDRGGGWYTEPGTNNHSPSCRHHWVSNIVTRK